MSGLGCRGPNGFLPWRSTCAAAAPASRRRRSPSALASRCVPFTATSTRCAQRRYRCRPSRGPGGGYALDRSYSLPPVNFTAREAALLVALGKFAIDMRLLPFSETLQSGLDKVRAALSTSAQRELLARLGELSFHGVPALPSDQKVRAAIERAWFEQQPVRIVYVDGNHVESKRVVRVLSVMMDRHETRVEGQDTETAERRHFRLDRILVAEVLRPVT